MTVQMGRRLTHLLTHGNTFCRRCPTASRDCIRSCTSRPHSRSGADSRRCSAGTRQCLCLQIRKNNEDMGKVGENPSGQPLPHFPL
ncbi:unnamed protein product [Protopolystoma xenopodis]|uniref:Uncharacterized protein n=1 Tax=Protopolystoma xenopodis TaxID=117903 RepID=A0A448X2R2_9PLAT|nr:unnamed protein product [Protopolystoma xenopodis]